MKAILWTCTALAVAFVIVAAPRARADGDDAEAAADEQASIEEKLETIVPVIDFKDAPLLEVLLFLKNACDVPIVFSEEIGELAAKTRMTVQLKNMPLKVALEYLLAPSGLTYRIADGEVHIVLADDEAESED